MVENHKFITAYFTNSERTVVESLWENDELGTIRTFELTAEEDNPHWIELLKHITIDELHERTYKFIRERNEDYEVEVIRIAKERGLVYDINEIDSQLYEVLAKILFKEYDPKKDKEKLFMFKLQLFELDFVKQCKDNDLKRNLRKAENFIDAISVTIDIKKSL
jgi:hypothetical protein